MAVCLVFIGAGVSAGQTVDVWYTSSDGSKKLVQEPSVSFAPDAGSNSTTITVDENVRYQVMDGFGAAITGSAAYVINQHMTSAQQDALLTELFTSSGIDLNFIRRPIGASDFDLVSYTYDDMPSGETDPNLANFSIDYDRTDILPVIHGIRQKNAGLKVMGTPWTAPAWMKKPTSLNGGSLSSSWYGTYADYLVKFVQAYEAEGIPIESITIQNEPLHTTGQYPSMGMSDRVQRDFLKNYLGPAFANAGLDTKIIAYDHNWDRPDYPINVLNDPAAKAYAAGTAFHAYAGDVSAQSQVHDAHPDRDIWFTEITGGDWDTNWASNVNWVMTNIIIGTTRHWAKAIIYWNLALDENGGPTNGGCAECRGVVTVNSQDGSVTRSPEYYLLGHISKFVDPGAARISSDVVNGIQTVAFDLSGQKTLIAHNNGTAANTFKVLWGDQSFTYTLGAGDAATFTWAGTQSGGGGGGGGGTTMHVESVVTGTESAGKGQKRGTATVTVHDDLDQPVGSATVTGTFSGTFNENVSGVTGTDGTVVLKTTATAGGGVTVNFCIDDVTHASLTYDPSQNGSSVTSCSSAGKTGLLRLEDEENPASFLLEEPHPNPFNPSTTIAFTLPQEDVVTLSVHDMLGRQMDLPIDGRTLSAGRHSIRYDASHLASGAYLIRLSTPTVSKTTKMHVLK